MKLVDLRERPELVSVIATWHQAEWGYLNPHKGIDDRIQHFQSHLGEQVVPSTYLAMDDDVCIGSASLIPSDRDDYPELTPWLASVYVDEQHRKRGIGAKLVNKIVSVASNTDYEKLYLFTPSKESFYMNLGWQIQTKGRYRDTDVTLMSIALHKDSAGSDSAGREESV